MKKLIVIRGNSGCGKSTVAEQLRKGIGGKVAVVGQDTLRRSILMETDSLENTDIIGLLEQTVTYCLDMGYVVIVEGILSKPKYKEILVKLMNDTECNSYVFYLDISIEESIRRHQTKPIVDEVTEDQLRSWYQPQNYLEVEGEIVIDENSTLEETVQLIKKSVEL